jgi:RNA polymerase sigma-70 factor (ECF subfamily)
MHLWSKELILEAKQHLTWEGTRGSVRRFQLEAAIQSAHASRSVTGYTDWPAIAELCKALSQFAPTVGVRERQPARPTEQKKV